MRVRFYDDMGNYIIVEATELRDYVKLHLKRSKKVIRKSKAKTTVKPYTNNLREVRDYQEISSIGLYESTVLTLADLIDNLMLDNIQSISLKAYQGKVQLSWCDGNPKEAASWTGVSGQSMINVCEAYAASQLVDED